MDIAETPLDIQIVRAIRQTIKNGSKAMVIPLPWFNLAVWPEEAMSLCVSSKASEAALHVDGEGNVNCCLLPCGHSGECGQ